MNKLMLGVTVFGMSMGLMGGMASSRAADAPATTTPATEPTAASTKFYGTVTAIDAAAKTFTIGEQTFTVGADTQMTKGDGSAATMADAVIGEPARGTYATAADGKTLTVSKVRFGKKAGGGSKGGKGGGKKKKDEPAATQQQ